MTLWWIGDVLLIVVLAVVIYLLHGVLTEARGIVPSIGRIAERGPRRLEGPRRRAAPAHHAGPGHPHSRRRSPTTAARST